MVFNLLLGCGPTCPRGRSTVLAVRCAAAPLAGSLGGRWATHHHHYPLAVCQLSLGAHKSFLDLGSSKESGEESTSH